MSRDKEEKRLQPYYQLIVDSLAIEAEEAKKAGALGFMARAMTQATLPHRKISDSAFVRRNGRFSLALTSHPDIGLPYGSYPRLILSWMTTEAVRKKERLIVLGPTLSGFMSQLSLIPAGGRWGTINRLRDQMKRLFCSSVTCVYETESRDMGMGFRIADKYDLWWDPKKPDQPLLWQSTLQISEQFFKEITERPIPVDMRALKALKQSPMALDIYCWSTYRMSYLRKSTEIPWAVLQMQFGAGYADTKRGLLDFKRAFLRELKRVKALYSGLNVSSEKRGLILKPSDTHIPMIESGR